MKGPERLRKLKPAVLALVLTGSLFSSIPRPIKAENAATKTAETMNLVERNEAVVVFNVGSKSNGLGNLDKGNQGNLFKLGEIPEIEYDENKDGIIIGEPSRKLQDGRNFDRVRNAGFIEVSFGTKTDAEGLTSVLIQIDKSFTPNFNIVSGELILNYQNPDTKKVNQMTIKYTSDGKYGFIYNNESFSQIILDKNCKEPKVIFDQNGVPTLILPLEKPNSLTKITNIFYGKDSKGKVVSITWTATPKVEIIEDSGGNIKKRKKIPRGIFFA